MPRDETGCVDFGVTPFAFTFFSYILTWVASMCTVVTTFLFGLHLGNGLGDKDLTWLIRIRILALLE